MKCSQGMYAQWKDEASDTVFLALRWGGVDESRTRHIISEAHLPTKSGKMD